jgi:hypothetical protein
MAKLTTAARKRIPASKFALPGGRYPIEDEAHARDALARASANATPHEQAVIRAHVHHAYPNMKIKEVSTSK